MSVPVCLRFGAWSGEVSLRTKRAKKFKVMEQSQEKSGLLALRALGRAVSCPCSKKKIPEIILSCINPLWDPEYAINTSLIS